MVELAIRIADEITAMCPDILDFVSTQGSGRPRAFTQKKRADGTLGPPELLEPVIFWSEELHALAQARIESAEEAVRMFSAMGAVEPPVPEFLRKPEADKE